MNEQENIMTNLLINSGPGSGKSTTICEAFLYYKATNKPLWLQQHKFTEEQFEIYDWIFHNIRLENPDNKQCAYIAYSAEVVERLSKKVHKIAQVKTCHGFGASVLIKHARWSKINHNRSIDIITELTGRNYWQLPNRKQWQSTIKHLACLKEEMREATMNNIEFVHNKYPDLSKEEIHKDIIDQCLTLIPLMKVIDEKGIEYIDQVWLANQYLKEPIFDLGFVDEAQDLSISRLTLCNKLCKNLVYVLDPNQSVFGFSGADTQAYEKIKSICDKELFLKESFRNPPNIIQKLNGMKPSAKLRTKNTTPGEIKQLSYDEAVKQLENSLSGLIICRYNAPLVSFALLLAQNKIKCKILGGKLVDQLIYMIKGTKATDLTGLRTSLMRDPGIKKPSAAKIYTDKIQTILFCASSCKTIEELIEMIKTLITKEPTTGIQLCSGHKSKGLEHFNVYILNPPIISEYAETQEEILQEENLDYVVLSRTLRNIYYIIPN